MQVDSLGVWVEDVIYSPVGCSFFYLFKLLLQVHCGIYWGKWDDSFTRIKAKEVLMSESSLFAIIAGR